MNWREAFIRQARSENRVRHRLNSPEVEFSHRLHYFQMVTEKLAKSYLIDSGGKSPPKISHSAFVSLLKVVKQRPDLRKALGFKDGAVFRKYIDSLLPLANEIQRLAPSMAALTSPNPEYSWQNQRSKEVVAPIDFDFPQFAPANTGMIKLERLVEILLRVAK